MWMPGVWDLPEPPLPPVAGELRARLEALEVQDLAKAKSVELENMRASHASLTRELESWRAKLKKQSEDLNELADLRLQLQRSQQEVKLLEEDKHRLTRLYDEAAGGRQANDHLEDENWRLRQQLAEAEREKSELRARLDQTQAPPQNDKLEEDNHHLRQALRDREKGEAELRSALDAQDRELAELTRERQSLLELAEKLTDSKVRRSNEQGMTEAVFKLREQVRQADVLQSQVEELKARGRFSSDIVKLTAVADRKLSGYDTNGLSAQSRRTSLPPGFKPDGAANGNKMDGHRTKSEGLANGVMRPAIKESSRRVEIFADMTENLQQKAPPSRATAPPSWKPEPDRQQGRGRDSGVLEVDMTRL